MDLLPQIQDEISEEIDAIKEKSAVISGLEIEYLTKEDLQDSFYSKIFQHGDLISLEHGKRRFGSFMNDVDSHPKVSKEDAPS